MLKLKEIFHMKYIFKHNTLFIFCKDTILSLYFHDVYEHTKASLLQIFDTCTQWWLAY